MLRVILFLSLSLLSVGSHAGQQGDAVAIKKVVLDYIESQHVPSPKRMSKALDKKLAKRTYWKNADGTEFVMETSRDTMLKVAETYNADGNKFPENPRKEIKILDIDGRVATIKLTADDWIDYMHLFKNQQGEWKIINVLWQYHEQSRQQSKK
ncbi:nuclear transport factor 2 family protein [Aliikangiella coralliicola]|uniref:Nuclear transport factor 2 family protein n=1 Tax=Aliikangiella coralliicola TaxID=2592383 RepID=A0A545UBV0_9GAMM|nr:nuclear transport factor 2 family protein [Aliikangiella coralliicola]TQV86951.1 nuclear transport factor 2 family protein [Aliikangiella coralliicola]